MSSTTPLTDAINALITRANETTGKSDTTLSDAVESLVDGYSGENIVNVNQLNNKTISGHVVVTGTSLRAFLFAGCNQITSVSCPNAVNAYSIRQNGGNRFGSQFDGCTSLQTVELPSLVNLTDYMFEDCTSLTRLYLPVATVVPTLVATGCSSLEFVVMPAVNGIVYAKAFNACTKLKAVDLYMPSFGRTQVFLNCSLFDTLIIRNNTVSSLGDINNFEGTPFASGGTGGILYVPQSLISSYQSANNWSTILGYENNQILSIEGSIYETQYADGTPIPTT